MKTTEIILGMTIFVCYSMVVDSQTCQVLKPEISSQYTGSCKEGLADGEGEATGIDFYKGQFKKGLPDGKGTYIWKNGATFKGDWKRGLRDGNGIFSYKNDSKDSTLEGKWKNDKYMGNPNIPQYEIEYRNSIGRVSFIRVGDRPYVKFTFSRNGGEFNNISNLLMQGSSGSESTLASFTGFEHVTFPFKGKVTFNAISSFVSSVLTCELRFSIFAPGSWVVTIFY